MAAQSFGAVDMHNSGRDSTIQKNLDVFRNIPTDFSTSRRWSKPIHPKVNVDKNTNEILFELLPVPHPTSPDNFLLQFDMRLLLANGDPLPKLNPVTTPSTLTTATTTTAVGSYTTVTSATNNGGGVYPRIGPSGIAITTPTFSPTFSPRVSHSLSSDIPPPQISNSFSPDDVERRPQVLTSPVPPSRKRKADGEGGGRGKDVKRAKVGNEREPQHSNARKRKLSENESEIEGRTTKRSKLDELRETERDRERDRERRKNRERDRERDEERERDRHRRYRRYYQSRSENPRLDCGLRAPKLRAPQFLGCGVSNLIISTIFKDIDIKIAEQSIIPQNECYAESAYLNFLLNNDNSDSRRTKYLLSGWTDSSPTDKDINGFSFYSNYMQNFQESKWVTITGGLYLGICQQPR